MAFNPAPSNWLDSWSEDGTTISVPIASFPELSAAEADGTTGDIRKTLYAICAKLYAEWLERAAADRPAKMQISRGAALDPDTGRITHTYSFTFVLSPSGVEVTAE